MKAVVYAGPGEVRVEDVPEPKIGAPDEALVNVTLSSICASDLHLLSGKTAGGRPGAVIGHEFVGVVSETGSSVTTLRPGDRVVGSFLIACGECDRCAAGRYNFCANRRALGLGQMTGDLDGAQAESVNIPLADLNLKPLTESLSTLSDERALFAGDVMATAFYAAELVEAGPGETVAVIGAGPVGLLSAMACASRGARAFLLDADPERVTFARERGLEAFDVSDMDAGAAVAGATEGALADAAVEAVGSPGALKSAMRCVREGGRVGVVGVYGQERLDLHLGMSWIRGVQLRFAGMANVQGHWDEALEATVGERLDPSTLITHRLPIDDAIEGYELFEQRKAMKVVLSP